MTPAEIIQYIHKYSSKHSKASITALIGRDNDDIELRVTLYVKCAKFDNAEVIVKTSSMIPSETMRTTSTETIDKFVVKAWKDAWAHEAMEWLYFDNKLVQDQHKDEK